MYKSMSDFLQEREAIPSNKLGSTMLQKDAEMSALPFRISTRLWIPLTDQTNKIRHFSVPIF
jgi:hypothetical protein